MQTKQPETEVKFTVTIPEVPETHRLEAETKAKEAYIMTLLRHGDLSSGRAAKLLGIPRVEVFDLMNVYGISPMDDTLTREDLERQVTQAKRNLEQ
jgi:predicted HTH domain antitoxin